MNFSRRSLLKTTGLAAGATALGSSLFGISTAFAQATPNDDVQTIINLAATAELFASTHYLAAINGSLGLGDVQMNYLKAAFISERDHLDLLISLGAKPVVEEFYVPDGLFSDKALFAQITEVAETTFVSAYLAATRIFSEAKQTLSPSRRRRLQVSKRNTALSSVRLATCCPTTSPTRSSSSATFLTLCRCCNRSWMAAARASLARSSHRPMMKSPLSALKPTPWVTTQPSCPSPHSNTRLSI